MLWSSPNLFFWALVPFSFQIFLTLQMEIKVKGGFDTLSPFPRNGTIVFQQGYAKSKG